MVRTKYNFLKATMVVPQASESQMGNIESEEKLALKLQSENEKTEIATGIREDKKNHAASPCSLRKTK